LTKQSTLLRSIQGQLDHYQERLRRLEKNLKNIIGENNTRASAYVVFKPFEELIGELLSLSEADQTEAIGLTLDNSVKNVTSVGLAVIAGLQPEENEPPRIVHTLLNIEAPFLGPDWGGKENSQVPNLRLLVFPPMEDELAESIKLAMKKINPGYIFASCDCSAGGLNIVEINFYQPLIIKEIITPMYYKGLLDALEKPHLYCLPDINILPMVTELKEIYANELAEIGTETIKAETKVATDTSTEPEKKLITQ